MAKSNEHKRRFSIDRFAKKYYCQNARLNQLRSDKARAKKKARKERKREVGVMLSEEI